ncbi:dihydroxyacetone kinase subunit L [Clostridium botulinum]|uniref:phosphoenolpyruvate--glycerone phosphotransferase n=1 Tax=Clostridium botulinum (strain Eklund 17B / Type B) TaxID=935198 RepID=B2THW9_CLOBB|nr:MULTISPECIES: dihydroxyacetone kinase subunit DhaL [unclassified Clostridium]ACD22131.1 dihydroxyacetone kinase, L subunit [Clostridium botulinum B str. Eklund 17B (NRP)]MBN1043860.1 dihydroxyacetone kinase subunit L [Clostridium botulinum]MBN1050536.1 dihydroxyacetone kinase subunit L [Clostridium botulinum]MBN1053822.1 dihydroxyacetone kinase subunit L [Clostridium botulinum]MBY6977354.1 dihydroxyacetone kinase subunit L [Clostridium botulinum]
MVTVKQVKDILIKVEKVIEENKLYLSELDAAIGDGDHGLNMNKGFKAVIEKIKDLPEDDLGNILKNSGMALVSNVGGASGPLYGTAFMKAAMVVNKKSEMDINDFVKVLEEALGGIKMRGKGQEGEKTMIDTLSPAIEAGNKSIEENKSVKEVLLEIKEAAKNGMEHTKDIVATKGRASYVGERSIGHIDAGATSMYLILNTIVEELTKEGN